MFDELVMTSSPRQSSHGLDAEVLDPDCQAENTNKVPGGARTMKNEASMVYS